MRSVGRNSVVKVDDGTVSSKTVAFAYDFSMVTMYAGVVKMNKKRNKKAFTANHRKYQPAVCPVRFSQKMSPAAGAKINFQSLTAVGLKCRINCLAVDVEETVMKTMPSGSFMAADRSLATSPHNLCSSSL